jgi:hypothetical protein
MAALCLIREKSKGRTESQCVTASERCTLRRALALGGMLRNARMWDGQLLELTRARAIVRAATMRSRAMPLGERSRNHAADEARTA